MAVQKAQSEQSKRLRLNGSEIKNDRLRESKWTVPKTQCRRSERLKVYGPEMKKVDSLLGQNLSAFGHKSRRSVKLGQSCI